MSPASFVQAHATHADWRVALADCQRQLQTAIAARTAQHGDSAPFTLGWCYLSDYYAPAAETILDELRLHFSGVARVGTVGVGVAASGVEYIDEPALVLMIAPLPRKAFRLFSGLQPLPAASSGFMVHTALVHAEGSTPDLQELIDELSARTATGYLFGGLSSARVRTAHMADGVFTGGLSGVAFGPEVGLISRVTQGCQPIGPWRNITEAERNFVVSLDDKPALDCVLQDLELDRDLPDHQLSQALSGTLVVLITAAEDVPSRPGQFGADTIVRHLVGVDRQHQVLAIAEHIEPACAWLFARATRKPHSSIWCASRRKSAPNWKAAREGTWRARYMSVARDAAGRTSARGMPNCRWCGTRWATCRWSAFSPVARSQGITSMATPGY